MDTITFVHAGKLYDLAPTKLDIYINGRNLIDIVREVEASIFPPRNVEIIKVPGGRDREIMRDFGPGAYYGIPAHVALFPSTYLLDKPSRFDAFNECGYAGRSLLTCECGNTGCACICARITITKKEVIWSGFYSTRRRSSFWTIGPFTFNGKEYVKALMKCDLKPPEAT